MSSSSSPPPPSITEWEQDDMTFVHVPPVSDDAHDNGAKEFTSTSGFASPHQQHESKSKKLAKLHVRGNISRNNPKKQFVLKLPTSETLIPGGAKAKKWVLSAYSADKSYIENELVFGVYRKFGELQREFSDTWPEEGSIEDLSARAYAPQSQMVNLIFQGRYAGIYYIMDKIEAREGRVWLPEASENVAQERKEVDGITLPQNSYLLSLDHSNKSKNLLGLSVPNFRKQSDAVWENISRKIEPGSKVCFLNLLLSFVCSGLIDAIILLIQYSYSHNILSLSLFSSPFLLTYNWLYHHRESLV